MQAVKRPTFAVKFNLSKVLSAFAFLAFIGLIASPAYASGGAFQVLDDKISGKTQEAYTTGKHILLVAAVLSLIVGLAPMLWGQVKVKWLVSCLVACVLFGLAVPLIDAFKVA